MSTMEKFDYKKLTIGKIMLGDIVAWGKKDINWIDKKFAACQSVIQVINLMGFKRGVELGTSWGASACTLLDNSPSIEELYTIDSYLPYVDEVPPYVSITEYDAKFIKLSAQRMFMNLPEDLRNKLRIIYGDTIETADKFEDEYFDFIWFDAHLSQAQLKEELETWYPKLKIGGMAGVHDTGQNGAGMIDVVHQFMEGKHTDGHLAYFNDTSCWLKGYEEDD